MLAQNCPKGEEPILTMAMQMVVVVGGGRLSNGHSLWEKWDFCSEFEKQFQMVIIVVFEFSISVDSHII